MKKYLLFMTLCVLGLFGTLRAQETITVGEGSSTASFLPCNTNYDNTVTQQIYLAEDFQGKSGKITSWAFKNAKALESYSTPVTVARNFKIYMANTDKAAFDGSKTDWVTVTENDLVFDGSVTYQAKDEWTVVNFDTPFEYEAGKNVVLCIDDRSSWLNLVVTCYSIDTETPRAMFAYRDGTTFDALNLAGTTANSLAPSNYVLQAQFTIEAGEGGETPEQPSDLANEFFYDFNDGSMEGWKNIDADGDGNVWYLGNSNGYDGMDGSYGLNSACYHNVELYPDNYIVTESKYAIAENSKFSFYHIQSDSFYYNENIGVVVSEDGENYDVIYDYYYNNQLLENWKEEVVDLSAYAGKELYIGLRHYNCNGADANGIKVDNIKLSAGEGGETPEQPEDPDQPEDPVVAQQYRIKSLDITDYYLTIFNNNSHESGPYGGVGIAAKAEDNSQIFTLEDAGNGQVYLLSADGYYVKCWSWNVDAYSTTDKTALTLADQGNDIFYLQNGNAYFKVEYVDGYYYAFGDCTDPSYYASWTLEAVETETPEDPIVPGNEIVVGEATTSYYSPFLTILGGGSRFEAIYRAEEIGQAATIAELAFSYDQGDEREADVNIYLAETEKDVFANPNDFTADSDLTLVYSGTAVTLCDSEWESFVLNSPFNYSGENNLLLVVTTNNTCCANKWNCYTDANAVLIDGLGLDSNKPVLKLILGEGGETPVDPIVPGEDMTVTIGAEKEQEPTFSLPYYDYYGNTFSQQIYTAEEMAAAGVTVGTIKSVAFKSATSTMNTRDITIFMLNTDKASFTAIDEYESYGYFETVTADDLVYEGTMTTTGENQWCGVELTTPFLYTGGNLLICVVDNTNNWVDPMDYFYAYFTEGKEAIQSYRDNQTYDPYAISELNGQLFNYKNVIQFNLTVSPGVNVNVESIDFGNIALGNYWPEKEAPSATVVVAAVGSTITSIESDNSFFVIPADIDLTTTPVKFNVTHDATAAAGEYTGNLTITATDETVVIPMTATVYEPVSPDVFELAQEVVFEENAYTDTPDFATLHDDYLLPNEANDGINPDAVYAFELTENAIVAVDVTGTNGRYAIYAEDFGGEAGPMANNSLAGEEVVLSTTFSYDFENSSLDDFTLVNYDEFPEYNWIIENGYLASYSFKSWYAEDGSWVLGANDADERLITNATYQITANTVLTFDMGRDENTSAWEYVTIQVTQDGENFTTLETVEVDPIWSNYDASVWYPSRVDVGAKLAAAGLSYGNYQIVLHHDVQGSGCLKIDNLALTERSGVVLAGRYYLVAAAEDAFTVNVSYMLPGDIPQEPEFNANANYRITSIATDWSTTEYTYASEKGTKVVKVDVEGTVDYMTYNANGQLASYLSLYEYEGEDGNMTADTMAIVDYIYNEENVLVGYNETAQMGWFGMQTTEYEYVYNEAGQLIAEQNAEMKTTFTYNEDGLVSEKLVVYVYGEGEEVEEEIDHKEVYTYENGKLVKNEYYGYDWFVEELYLAEETIYEYDANGNCVKATTNMVNYDEENNPTIAPYSVAEYEHSTIVSNDKVFYFAYPHMALANPAQPAHANIITKELSYYRYFDEETQEIIEHSHSEVVYNYEEYELEGEVVPTVPAAPVVTAEATGETTIVLTWAAVEGATSYNVYQGTEKVATVEATTYTVEGLTAGTQYCFTVTAVNEVGESSASNEACATTDEPAGPTVPSAPVITVAEQVDDAVHIAWNAVAGATGYKCYYGGQALTDVFTDTEVYIQVVEVGEYCFTITAINEVGESEHTEACVTVVVPEGFNVPAAPVLTATIQDATVSLTWAAVEGAVFYTVYYGDQVLGETQYTSANIDITGVEPGVHCFTVTASNLAGESAHSEEACVEYGVGVSENEAAFNVYPNPVDNKLFVESTTTLEEISIYSVTGTLVYRQQCTDNNVQIDVTDFDGGVYIMKLRTSEGETVQRFIKK